ncbi:MAG: exodeoxyribonuclease VII small subunit [Actinomycetales bacterium]|nr:MAG: exodeoxyribonuclease VII small subunit [Actinomycetales bacterium]
MDAGISDIPDLGYEQARDELVAIVARLEGGQAPLEESLTLWHRGEALAAHCSRWLDAAQAQIAKGETSGQ